MPRRCAAPTSAMAASGAGQVISSAAERPGSLSVPAARNAPRQIAARSPREPVVSLFGQPAHRTSPLVEQPGLAGERLAAFDHPHREVAAVARAGALHVHQLRADAVDLHEVAGDATREDVGVELRLDRDAVRDRVEAAREPQKRGELGHPGRRSRVAHRDELGLHVSGQRHGSPQSSGSGTRVKPTRRSRLFAPEVPMLHPDRHARLGCAAAPRARAPSTTERCLPPVQPIATTELRLFSR